MVPHIRGRWDGPLALITGNALSSHHLPFGSSFRVLRTQCTCIMLLNTSNASALPSTGSGEYGDEDARG
jgi:hypothetical protein